jgi:tetratricopeptide (TPR) repeat protein
MLQDPAVPALLGERYARGARLGQGGMGTVFEARDTRTGARIAVKVLHPDRSSPDDLVRFKREFRAAARLAHPHCLPVFELDRGPQGEWFYTMEFAPGGHLRPGPSRPWPEIAEIGLQILAALDHIHAKRIIHRDIKPHNILIHSVTEDRPWLKLADFGISKVVDLDEQVGTVLGSLPYLSPEQLEGRADPRSDLYSLGLVLYELAAGRHPFAGAMGGGRTRNLRELRDWRRRHGASVAPLGEIAPDVAPAFASLIMRLLDPNAEARPATAAIAFDELAELAAPQPAAQRRSIPPLTRATYLAPAALIGRSGERGLLQRFVDTVIAGLGPSDPVVLFVEGAAGAGKSRLMGELVRIAEDEVQLQSGAWREGTGTWPLGALVAALALEPGAARPLPAAAVDGPMDEESTVTARAATADVLGLEGERWGGNHQLANAILALGRHKPLIFLMEDAHWADATSLQLLAFLVRRVALDREARPRLAFVITHRPTDDRPELAALHRVASAHAASLTIRLGPLAPGESLDVVCSMLSSPPTAPVRALARHLHASSQGNPLLLGQTLQLLLAEGRLRRSEAGWQVDLDDASVGSLPGSLQQAVGDRAAKLSLDAKQALAAAAVIGREVDFELLQLVSRMDSLLLLDCVDEALRAEFLLEHPTRPAALRFVHDRVRDAIVARLPERERVDLHRRTALVLEGRRQDDPGLEADLGHHLRAAGDLAAAQAAYQRGGRHAWNGHAFARAADLLGEALAVAGQAGAPPAAELVELHADACLGSGRYEAALAGYQQRLGAAPDLAERNRLLPRCAEAEWRRGNTAAAGQQFENILRSAGFAVPTSRLQCLVHTLVGIVAASASVYARGPTIGASTIASQDSGEQAITLTCLRLAEVFYYSDLPRALHYMTTGFRRSLRNGDARLLTDAFSQQAFTFAMVSLHGLARRLLGPARAHATQVPPLEQARNRLLHGMTLAGFGDARGYASQMREAESLVAHSAEPMNLRQVWTLLGEALLALGDVQAAAACGEKVLRLSQELADDRGRGWGLYLRGWAALRLGDVEAARGWLFEAAQAAERGGDVAFGTCAQGRAAFACFMSGDLDEALVMSRRAAEEFARRFLRHPSTANDGIFLAAAAAVLQRDGRLPSDVSWSVRRRRFLGREVAHTLRLSAPLYWAGRGAWEVARGRDGRGQRMLQRAIALADRDHLAGELHDVHAVAGRLLAGEAAAAHLARAEQLRQSFNSPAPEGGAGAGRWGGISA